MTAALSGSPGLMETISARLRRTDVTLEPADSSNITGDDVISSDVAVGEAGSGDLAEMAEGGDLSNGHSGELRWHNASIATYSPTARLFRCGQCPVTAFLARQLADHWLGTHADFKAFQCPRCPYMSSWQRCVRMHLVRHHGDRVSAVSEFNNTNVMAQILGRLSVLKYEAEQHAPATPSPPPAASEETPGDELETELEAGGKRHHCPHCPYSTHRRDLYNRHENIHKSDKPFQCYICQRMFNRADHVKKHFLRIHRDDPYDVTRIRRIPPKTLTAQVYYSRAPPLTTIASADAPQDLKPPLLPDIRPAVLPDLKSAPPAAAPATAAPSPPPPEESKPQVLSPNPKVSVRRWARPPSRAESPCRKPPPPPHTAEADIGDAEQKENRRRSEASADSTDSEGPPAPSSEARAARTPRQGAFGCPECPWRGFDSWCLKRHMNTHTKPYACPLCPYRAARSERLTWHASKVHYRKICIKCFFVCEDAVTLSVHQLTNHQNGQSRQSFTCVVCALPFSLHAQLEAHMVSAHGRQMLDCGVCTFRTTDPAVLTDHVRYSHQSSSGSGSPAATAPVILNVPSVARSDPASSPDLKPEPLASPPPLPPPPPAVPLLPTCDECAQVRPPLVCTHAGSALHCQAAGCGFAATSAPPLEAHVAARHADGALRCPHCAAPLGSVLEFCLHWPLHHVMLCWSCAELTEQHFTVLPPPPPPPPAAGSDDIDCSPFLRMEMTEGNTQEAEHEERSHRWQHRSENSTEEREEEEEDVMFLAEEEEEAVEARETGKRSRKQRRPQRRASTPEPQHLTKRRKLGPPRTALTSADSSEDRGQL